MNRHTGARLVNEAILYRWHNRLGHSRNVAVARYRDAQGRIRYMAAANTPGGPHAERNLLNRLHRQGIGANQIEALYTERSPCRRSCQPFLR